MTSPSSRNPRILVAPQLAALVSNVPDGFEWVRGAGPEDANAEVWLLDARQDLAGARVRVAHARALGIPLPVLVVTSAPSKELDGLGVTSLVVPVGAALDVAALEGAVQQMWAAASPSAHDPLVQALFDAATGACMVLDVRARVAFANEVARAWSARMGAESTPGADFLACARPWFGDAAAVIRPAWTEARQGRGVTTQFEAAGVPYVARFEPLGDDGRVVVSAHDVTQRRQAEQRLRHEVTHDRLTGLTNRTRVLEVVASQLRGLQPPTVLTVDVDRFKTINESLGLAIGDRLLVAFGARLAQVAGEGALVARLGGDEFAVLPALQDVAASQALGETICRAARDPFLLDDLEVFVSASVGVVCGHAVGTADELLRAASVSVYTAKEQGGDRVVVHDDAMDGRAQERLALETDVRNALATDAFTLAFQPILALADGAVVGLEALLRWRHPVRGDVPPERFLPLCEELDLQPAITALVLERATAAFVRAAAMVPALRGARVHVNLSPGDLLRAELVDDITRALARADLPAERLCVELAESAVMRDPEVAAVALQRLRSLGVRVAIDDFGTGYSSLSWLSRLPVDAVKVDGTFVRDGMESGLTIVRTVLTFAEAFGLEVIAEGVETEDQRARLLAAGCGQAQGYVFAHPVGEALLPQSFASRGAAP